MSQPASPAAPTSTYRLQLHGAFTFDDAIQALPYIASLGVSHVYCSPWLKSAAGSVHGYDVVEHTQVDPELGGAEALARFRAACTANGLGIVLDVVPNHMGVDAPEDANPVWWDALATGPEGRHGFWFDVESWPIVIPVLGDDPENVVVDGDVVRYHEHVFPLSGRDRFWKLESWKGDGPTYRRFFDVTTLAGIRVEEPGVFRESHVLIAAQVADGTVDGLRIDHPDGLADPGGYLDMLAEACPDTWVVVEKILEPGEQLSRSWKTAGTTGYDALRALTSVLLDPAGARALDALWEGVGGQTWHDVETAARHQVLTTILAPEVARLARELVAAGLTDDAETVPALVALLAATKVYRAYLPGATPAEDAQARAVMSATVQSAVGASPELAARIHEIAPLVTDGPLALVRRFGQTTGPALAKSVEDTAFYRHHRLLALTEVGGDPSDCGGTSEDWHGFCIDLARDWPATMTTLATHDTKKGVDVRARLLVVASDAVSDDPAGWPALAATWIAAVDDRIAKPFAYGLLQVLVGAWPVSAERLDDVLPKMMKEAKDKTSWTAADQPYEDGVRAWLDEQIAGPTGAAVAAYVGRIRPAALRTSATMRLLQLTMPGVPDTYAGAETEHTALVDPDNRRPVDFAGLRASLASDEDGLQRLTAMILQLRKQDPPGWDGIYEPLVADGPVLAYRRGKHCVAVPRYPGRSLVDSVWTGQAILPEGEWRDLLSGADGLSGTIDVVAPLLLERENRL